MSAPESAEAVDLFFALQGRALPLDYAAPLRAELARVLPALLAEPQIGIHPIYGLSPGEGEWYLSRRSRLGLRLPLARVAAAQTLAAARLALAGETLALGATSVRELQPTPVLYARCVAFTEAQASAPLPPEAVFFAACQAALAAAGMAPRTLVCGRRQRIATAEGVLHGFSLMVGGLDDDANLRLQRQGLGVARQHGCGVFVPHKATAAVTAFE